MDDEDSIDLSLSLAMDRAGPKQGRRAAFNEPTGNSAGKKPPAAKQMDISFGSPLKVRIFVCSIL